jgi:hypothetical protein|tara:strand:- start:386 stop:595 length:210 start_codon:yes stop_codon:yes gene_type:complete
MSDKKNIRKLKARKKRVKAKILKRRQAHRKDVKDKKEIWKIKRQGEKLSNRLTGATYRKPKEISENTEE